MPYRFPDRLNKMLTLLKPISAPTDYGTKEITFKPSTNFWCHMRTFSGTETVVDDILVIKDTAVIDCYYNPNIAVDCRLKDRDGAIWKIISSPENINGNNQYMQFKIERIGAENSGYKW